MFEIVQAVDRNAVPPAPQNARQGAPGRTGGLAVAAAERGTPATDERPAWRRSITASLLLHLAILGALNRLPIEETSPELPLVIPVGLVGVGGAGAPAGSIGAIGSRTGATESAASPDLQNPIAASDPKAAPSASTAPAADEAMTQEEMSPAATNQPVPPRAAQPHWPLPERKPVPPQTFALRSAEHAEHRTADVMTPAATVLSPEPERAIAVSPEAAGAAPATDKESRRFAGVAGRGGTEAGRSGGATGPEGSGDDYLQRLRRWLNRFTDDVYPDDARKRKEEGTVLLSFALARDGTVLRVAIRRSSGFPALDEAAVRLVRAASPVPPFPPHYKEDVRNVTIPLRFSLTFFQKLF